MFTISGLGCGLLDFIYADIDFSTDAFASYRSRKSGDGGLEPGKLVFADDFEAFAGESTQRAIERIIGGRSPSTTNIGGPSLVSMIAASQLLDRGRFEIEYTGAIGSDETGDSLRSLLGKTSLGSVSYVHKSGPTPCSYVLSDPRHDGGRGERTFLNVIGAAGELLPQDIHPSFFEADLVAFGGTALVPKIHDELDLLLDQAKRRGAFTVVNTVYDFRHQQENPSARWPLGSGDRSYPLIDLLIADVEEALRLSGEDSIDGALAFFQAKGVGAAIITNGAEDIALYAGAADSGAAGRFEPCPPTRMPVSRSVVEELRAHPELKGDTTGCGDNFAGGAIADIAMQLEGGAKRLDLRSAAARGAVCGGLACFQVGGVFFEDYPSQKREKVEDYLARYQVGTQGTKGSK
jgi:sugar/nucleoside kinase (ribokinase family)